MKSDTVAIPDQILHSNRRWCQWICKSFTYWLFVNCQFTAIVKANRALSGKIVFDCTPPPPHTHTHTHPLPWSGPLSNECMWSGRILRKMIYISSQHVGLWVVTYSLSVLFARNRFRIVTLQINIQCFISICNCQFSSSNVLPNLGKGTLLYNH